MFLYHRCDHRKKGKNTASTAPAMDGDATSTFTADIRPTCNMTIAKVMTITAITPVLITCNNFTTFNSNVTAAAYFPDF